jgi:hypothetical protein
VISQQGDSGVDFVWIISLGKIWHFGCQFDRLTRQVFIYYNLNAGWGRFGRLV